MITATKESSSLMGSDGEITGEISGEINEEIKVPEKSAGHLIMSVLRFP